jgi:hypothetical protein
MKLNSYLGGNWYVTMLLCGNLPIVVGQLRNERKKLVPK